MARNTGRDRFGVGGEGESQSAQSKKRGREHAYHLDGYDLSPGVVHASLVISLRTRKKLG